MSKENAIIVIGEILPGDNKHSEYVWKGTCPYCGEKHTHNVGHDIDKVLSAKGARLAHCAEREGTEKYYILSVEDNWRKEFDKREKRKNKLPHQAQKYKEESTAEAVFEAEGILNENLSNYDITKGEETLEFEKINKK